ncbi:MAG: hypothetical protein V4591_08890, partial [Bdellovibrionota bacterium]
TSKVTQNPEIMQELQKQNPETNAIQKPEEILQKILKSKPIELTKKSPNIHRFFDENGFFNWNGLDNVEQQQLIEKYNVELLQVANKFNTGVATNASADVLLSFFRHVPAIAQSRPKTVKAGA